MSVPIAPSAGTVRLAALECAASCVVSALAIRGMDPRGFLLGYWHIAYYDGMLMSAKNIKWIDLAYEYGIRATFTSGSPANLREVIDEGDMAIVLCKASKLSFFPPSMLGFESAGFYHCVLLHGRGDRPDSYRVVDPVADYDGESSAHELAEASVRTGQFVYCRLSFDAAYRRPSARESFLKEAAANLASYEKSGAAAFESFRAYAADFENWDAATRRAWAERNAIALSALIRMRALVWQSYADTGLLTDDELEEGRSKLGDVVRAWMNINLLFVKIGRRASSGGHAEPLARLTIAAEQAETRLLAYLAARELIPNEN